ncbi:hypothetical protein [Sphingobium nicotianae]|uniref:Uncharacterized protein n=1 Tax=Sphingobium nicotianae TaxID=2782607 RepID=A0A9X1DH08_9SPHN|nr:hypothetical protein [Sphingobium nicotianae]MBT2189123.1 hypothetical protein [Sphingobium nicotianae]
MTETTDMAAARAAAARHLRDQGYPDEAAIVAAGQGDDFAEVRIALSLWKIMHSAKSPPVAHHGRRLVGEEC